MEWPRMVVRGTTSNHASVPVGRMGSTGDRAAREPRRSEEHTSELQSRLHLVCRLLLEKKKNNDHRGGRPASGRIACQPLHMRSLTRRSTDLTAGMGCTSHSDKHTVGHCLGSRASATPV